jgi:uncharacterized protein YkwD
MRLLLLLLLTGCSTGLDPIDDCDNLVDFGWDPADEALEDELLEETNALRATGADCVGGALPPADPLVSEPRLRCAARRHALDMAANDFFAHDSPTTGDAADRVNDVEYEWSLVAENLAAGRSSAAESVEDWLGSTTGHCDNLMAADAVHAGMALARSEDAEFPTYWVQVFAAPR